MTTYGFAQSLAVDESMTPARNAVGYVYNYTTDPNYTSPLDVYDLGGVPIAGSNLVANDQGIVPPFQVVGVPLVRWKSGPYITEMLSGQGVVDALATAQASAASSDASAAASATSAATAGLPSGANPGDVIKADGSGAPVWGAPDALSSVTWDNVTSKPAVSLAGHTHTPGEISTSTAVGRSLITAADAAAARTLIAAAPSSVVSWPGNGLTGSTTAAGNHGHTAAQIPFTPTGSITATDTQAAIIQAAATGGGGTGATTVLTYTYRSGAYPTLPTTKPTGAEMVQFLGPVQPTTYASWMGTGPTQVPTKYDYVATS